jgi:hypothetical protein
VNRTLVSHQCRIYDWDVNKEEIRVNVYGGTGCALHSIVVPMKPIVLDQIERWATEGDGEGAALDLFEGPEGALWLQRSVLDTDPPPPTDTPVSRFIDGYRQGQKDSLGLRLRYPLARFLPKRRRSP